MDNYKKEIEKLLIDLKKIKIDRRQIEKDLNYREFYLDQAISKGGNKKLFQTLSRYLESKLKNIDKNNIPLQENVTKTEKDITMQAILNLTETNNEAVKNTTRLIALLEQKQLTAEIASKNHQDVLSIFDGVLDALAEIASGKKFHSKEEAVVELNRKFYLGVGK